MAALDVKKAFLKGITYKQLAEQTQEPERNVNFELSQDAIEILRLVPGFEDFDPAREVLHCTKPGTGCVDAPRCFVLKLTKATNEVWQATPSTIDDQLICLLYTSPSPRD